MKKCPYCAESIQDNALICRYCNRKVKKNGFKKIFIIAVLLVALILGFINASKIKYTVTSLKYKIESLQRDIYSGVHLAMQLIEDLKSGVAALKELTSQNSSHELR